MLAEAAVEASPALPEDDGPGSAARDEGSEQPAVPEAGKDVSVGATLPSRSQLSEDRQVCARA